MNWFAKFWKVAPHKIYILQEVGDDKHARRILFCETITEKLKQDPDLLIKHLFYSDTSTNSVQRTSN